MGKFHDWLRVYEFSKRMLTACMRACIHSFTHSPNKCVQSQAYRGAQMNDPRSAYLWEQSGSRTHGEVGDGGLQVSERDGFASAKSSDITFKRCWRLTKEKWRKLAVEHGVQIFRYPTQGWKDLSDGVQGRLSHDSIGSVRCHVNKRSLGRGGQDGKHM